MLNGQVEAAVTTIGSFSDNAVAFLTPSPAAPSESVPAPLKVSAAVAFRKLSPPSARSLPTVSAPSPENVE